jgi:hypothetical protein
MALICSHRTGTPENEVRTDATAHTEAMAFHMPVEA